MRSIRSGNMPLRGAARAAALVLAGAAVTACAAGIDQPSYDEAAVTPALQRISGESLLANIRTLASDEFEGRGPGTPGEEKTVAFLLEQFGALPNIQPGNPDGSWTQAVTLVGMRAERDAAFTVNGQRIPASFPNDFVAMTRRVTPEVRVEDSELVFVGYGVVAPEYGWDDYKDVDVRGKTIIMLVNDPAVPHPADPSRLDDDMFRGDAMTYYGRWTYKYEIATERGAAAAIIIHETGPAGYPWTVVSGSWGGENFDIVTPDRNMGRVAVESWITRDLAAQIFAASGLDFDDLKAAAARTDFRPVALNGTASFQVRNTQIREIESNNVIARLEGSHPERRNEYIVYTAHWDHLGIGPRDLSGDTIYNGAQDNASGTAGLIEIARAYSALETAPERTILFLAVTAEERGLLGAKHYATQPLYPLERTLANINMDGLNQWGRTRDIAIIGRGNTTLEDILEEEVIRQGRVVVSDPEPAKGFFYRSDHFEFAKVGVPALYTDKGTQYIGRPDGWGLMKREEYTAEDYHKPSDEVKDDWDLSGAVEDLRLYFLVGFRVANATAWPAWKDGTEFKATRDAMLRRAVN
jgi:Zn-dependent M28 family amino/carboxypeptidase